MNKKVKKHGSTVSIKFKAALLVNVFCSIHFCLKCTIYRNRYLITIAFTCNLFVMTHITNEVFTRPKLECAVIDQTALLIYCGIHVSHDTVPDALFSHTPQNKRPTLVSERNEVSLGQSQSDDWKKHVKPLQRNTRDQPELTTFRC